MLRYRSNQNLKKKIEQSQLLSSKSSTLGTKTVLKTRSQTLSRTTTPHMLNTSRTKSTLKRKLLVYKKDGKFYIDHAAAYALKLTNVRAIMTGKPHLIEIALETLFKFQNSEDIEIEYQELSKEKDIGKSSDDLANVLGELTPGEYGIGIHGIDKGNNEEKQTIASNINSTGLNISNNSKTILSTSISLGTNEVPKQLSEEIMSYQIGNGSRVNVVIAVPLYIQNEAGEKIFLGFPDTNKRTSGQQYEEHCILDRICANLRKIPSEFILGYYCENSDGSKNFVKNSRHYIDIPQEEREDLYKELYSNMDDIAKSYNNLIASGNIEQLSAMNEKMRQLGLNSYMVVNAMALAQKNKEQAISTRQINLNDSQENGQTLNLEKSRRKVVLYDTQQSAPETDITKSRRKILQEICADTKLSDLSIAKEALREGLEEHTKNCEEKEV